MGGLGYRVLSDRNLINRSYDHIYMDSYLILDWTPWSIKGVLFDEHQQLRFRTGQPLRSIEGFAACWTIDSQHIWAKAHKVLRDCRQQTDRILAMTITSRFPSQVETAALSGTGRYRATVFTEGKPESARSGSQLSIRSWLQWNLTGSFAATQGPVLTSLDGPLNLQIPLIHTDPQVCDTSLLPIEDDTLYTVMTALLHNCSSQRKAKER